MVVYEYKFNMLIIIKYPYKTRKPISVRGCNPKHKCKVWDVTRTGKATLSHDIVGNMLSDKGKWL